jgi:hypothetical protein
LQFYIATALAIEVTSNLEPLAIEIIESATPEKMTDKLVEECVQKTKEIYEKLSKNADSDAVARGSEFAKKLKTAMRRRLSNKGKGKSSKPA